MINELINECKVLINSHMAENCSFIEHSGSGEKAEAISDFKKFIAICKDPQMIDKVMQLIEDVKKILKP